MARVKRAVGSKKHRKQVLEQAKGYYGNKSRSVRAANEQVMRSGQYAFRDRRAKKGEFRRLWIQRINAACRHVRHELQPVHRRAERGRHRGRPQDPGRPRRHRHRRVRRARRGRQGGALSDQLTFSNPKVQRLRRLLGRRSARLEEGAFVVEGPSLVDAGGGEPAGSSRPCSSPPGTGRIAGCPSVADVPVHELGAERDGARRHHRDRRSRCSASVRLRTAPLDVARIGLVRARRRPHRRSRQRRHDAALGRGGRRRRRGAHRRLGRRVQPEGGARLAPVRCSTVPVVVDVVARRRAARAAPGCRDRSAPRRTRRPTASVRSYTDVDLTRPVARSSSATRRTGCPPTRRSTQWITIPHAGRAESLNVAMAATVLVFEVARQRRGARATL